MTSRQMGAAAVCACLCFPTASVDLKDILPIEVASFFNLAVSSPNSKVKVIGQRLRLEFRLNLGSGWMLCQCLFVTHATVAWVRRSVASVSLCVCLFVRALKGKRRSPWEAGPAWVCRSIRLRIF